MMSLNTAIAMYLEPKPECAYTSMLPKPPKYWLLSTLVDGTGLRDWKPVDFEHDARLYMALYFELPFSGRVWLASCPESEFGNEVCLSFCKLKGIEVVVDGLK